MPKKTYLTSIDVLRGIAAFWVVLYHTWGFFYPNSVTTEHVVMPRLSDGPLFLLTFFLIQFGYLGVNLFFVLSGFCIHLPQAKKYLSTPSEQLNLKKFFIQRFRRLYPAYLASIVLVVLIQVFIFILQKAGHKPGLDLVAVARDAGISVGFLQFIFPKSLQFNGVYWTLLFELQFYLLYPLLLKITRKTGFVPVLIVLFLVQVGFSTFPITYKYAFFLRYFEWFLGMYIAESYLTGKKPFHSKPLLIAGVVFLIGGILTNLSIYTWMSRDFTTSIGFGFLLASAIQKESDNKLSALWSNKTLVQLGTSSYSLYLIHLPLLTLYWTLAEFASKVKPALGVTKFGIIFVVFLMPLAANLFYKQFELRFMKKKAV
jgi:peptidoglycan/LPS O-acetylase OafA/YrhL